MAGLEAVELAMRATCSSNKWGQGLVQEYDMTVKS